MGNQCTCCHCLSDFFLLLWLDGPWQEHLKGTKVHSYSKFKAVFHHGGESHSGRLLRPLVMLHLPSRSREWWMPVLSSLSSFYQSSIPAHGMLPPRVSRSCYLNEPNSENPKEAHTETRPSGDSFQIDSWDCSSRTLKRIWFYKRRFDYLCLSWKVNL